MSTPHPLEEQGQLDTGEPMWNPWDKPPPPSWYSGIGPSEDNAYTSVAGQALGGAAAKGELLMSGALRAAGELYSSVGTPRPVGQELEPIGKQVEADAKARLKTLQPNPATTGVAARALFGLGSQVPVAIGGFAAGGPAGAFGALASTEGYGSYRELVDAGVDKETAAALATFRGSLAGAGAVAPMVWGASLLPRLASGVASNTAFGVVGRATDSAVLRHAGYADMADQEQTFDRTQLLVDAVLGAGFGAFAHLGAPPSDVRDAALATQLALRNRRSAPGVAVTPGDAAAHLNALEQAIDDLQNERPVNVADTGIAGARVLDRAGETNPAVLDLFEDHFRQAGLLEEDAHLQQLESVLDRKLRGEPEPVPAAAKWDIPRAKHLTPEQSAIEGRFAEALIADYEGAVRRYNAIPETQGGTILSVDTARELSDDYLADRTQSDAVHEPASAFIKRVYAEALSQPPGPGQDPRVLFMGGGTGSGKSTTIKVAGGRESTHAQLVYDSNLNGFDSARRKIDQAHAAGKDVAIFGVWRDPIDSLQGAFKRAMRQEREHGTGRTVPLNEHLATHVGFNQTIRQLAAHYAGDPRVQIVVLDNSKGVKNLKAMKVEDLPKLDYNYLRERALETRQQAFESGAISRAVYEGFAFKGRPGPDESAATLPTQVTRGAGPHGLGAAADRQPEAEPRGRRPDQLETVSTAAGRQIQTRARIAELSELKTSDQAGYPKELQPRQRGERRILDQQVREIAQGLIPERLGASPEADRGAPIVSAANEVESGNGRVMALKRAYETLPEKAAAYRAFLESQGHDLTGFRQPVLVRERQTPMTMAERQQFALEANQSATASMAPVEQGLADAKRLSADSLAMLAERADLDSRANQGFARAFLEGIPVSERAALLNPDGSLNQAGVRRAQAAVLARAYGGTEASNRILGRMLESTDTDQRNILGALLDVAPAMARLRQMVADGVLPEQFDITDKILGAVDEAAALRESGQSLEEHLKQTDMVTPRDPMVDAILKTFYGESGRAAGRPKIAEALANYVIRAASQRLDQGSLFGEPPVPPAELLGLAKPAEPKAAMKPAADMFGLRTPQGEGPATGERLSKTILEEQPNLAITVDAGTVPAQAAQEQALEESRATAALAPKVFQAAADCFLRSGT